MTARSVTCLSAALLVLASAASFAEPIPPPKIGSPPGIVRVWGNEQMRTLVARWGADLQVAESDLRIDANLAGSDIAMAGLYTGQADIALLGREATESELKAFEWVYRFKPTRIEILTGSLDLAGKSPALVIFVHENNSIERLTVEQLRGIFGHDHRNPNANIRTWGELGITGRDVDRTIRLYGPSAISGTGRFFRKIVLGESTKMNWDAFAEFDDPAVAGHRDASGREILEALARDRFGVALANLQFAQEGIKPVALAVASNGPYFLPTEVTLVDRRYPLTRSIWAYVTVPPDGEIDRQVVCLLRHILSPAGQDAAVEHGFLPINPAVAARERARLR